MTLESPESPEPREVPLSRRPAKVASLMRQGHVYPGWYTANKRMNKFYVVNLGHVMDALMIDYSSTERFFEKATEIILKETTWNKEYQSKYEASWTQLAPKIKNGPKHFGIAATIIVAMEVAAAELNPQFDVYEYLAIIPAQYFVDRLEAPRLQKLRTYYAGLSEAERVATFGENGRSTSFDAVCLTHLGQTYSEALLDEHCAGYCVTRYVAELLLEFVNKNFPAEYHVGPVFASGEDSISTGLGTDKAAPSLRVPKSLYPLPIEEGRREPLSS
ncbi:MAG: hypothetical protein QOD09_3766 [Bradyrhizobium sp.]|jgi:hypothetical protein|nr:hypothetical protein [Bradyrhizobium sp.]MEA2951819.1 hypothetical protein [Alphaproteobacteria bacterium]